MDKDMDAHKSLLKLVHAYQMSMRKVETYHLNESKALLREKIEKWRCEIITFPGEAIDYAEVFPVEVWTMILRNVTDWKDVINCAKTDPLLHAILHENHFKWNFGKILPFISKYVSGENLLDYRLVCKRWCSSIDELLESCQSIKDPCKCDEIYRIIPSTGEPENIESGNVFLGRHHQFNLHIPGIGQPEDEWLKKIRDHPRNPFIGRSINITPTKSYGRLPARNMFLQKLNTFLDFSGEHIWHLSIMSCFNPIRFKNCAGFYFACAKILTHCSNLRSFSIDGSIKIQQQIHRDIILKLELLPHHAYLESLKVQMDHNLGLLIQDKLVEKYSSQLKRICVHQWNDVYHTYVLENLSELQILSEISAEMVVNLKKLKIPKLCILGLCLKKNGKPSSVMLYQLCQLVSHFQNVSCLRIKFAEKFVGFSANDIVTLPDHLTFSPLIKVVEFDCTSVIRSINFDLLFLFPCVRNISIKLTLNASGPDKYAEKFLHSVFWNDPEYNMKKNWETMLKPSNIWDAIHSLEILKFRFIHRDTEDFESSRIFTRQGYVRKHIEENVILNQQLNCAHREADRQNVIRRSLFREKLGPRRIGQERNKEQRFEKILPLILSYLDKSDILSCRKVCKEWRAGVDAILESCFSADIRKPELPFMGSYTPTSFYGFIYYFKVTTFNAQSHNDDLREAMLLHMTNPFIGRTVWLRLELEESELTQVFLFPELLGKHVWHLIISGPDKFKSLNSALVVPTMLQELLTMFPNLRSLCILQGTHFDLDKDIDALNLPALQHLENLYIDKLESLKSPIMPKIVKPYSSQLKCLNICIWETNFESRSCYQWDNLEELHVNDSSLDKILDSLTKITALKLTRLYINSTRDQVNHLIQLPLKALIAVTHNLKGLTELHLKLSGWEREFSSEDAQNMTAGFIASSTLTHLELIIETENFSFDFLIFFPYLKSLKILELIDEMLEDDDTDSDVSEEDQNRFLLGFMWTNEEYDTTGFVQLPELSDTRFWKHIQTDEKIYKLNIWQVLRSLHILELGKSGKNIPTQKNFFTRQGYEQTIIGDRTR